MSSIWLACRLSNNTSVETNTPTPQPWLQHYPSGIPAKVDADTFTTLVDLLAETLKRFSNRKAFTLMGKSLTFKEVDDMSTQFGAYLQSRGLEAGDRFAIMSPNLLQYPIALLGALKAGITVVNTNPLYTPREMQHQFTDSGVKGILIAENFAANLEKILPNTDIKVVITTSIGELLGFKGKLVNFAVRNVKRMVPAYNLPNAVVFKDALNAGKKFTLQPHKGKADDVIIHQYTGGTTGVSKGAMLTNRNLVANTLQVKAWMDPTLSKEDDLVVLCPLPLYHIFAFTCNCLVMMSYGAETVLIVNPRDLSTVIKAFQDHKVKAMTGVNTLFNALANSPEFAKANVSNMKLAFAGGMALQNAVADKFKQVTGCTVIEGYGMTESSPVATVNPLDGTHRQGTIGLPIPSTQMRVVDDAQNPVAEGEVGELQIKGPQIMKGYYNKPDETAKTISSDGWLSTGDMATMDSSGFFKIVDRKKDMILVSGFNVYPNEIEDVMASHPKVLEVAVIGVPDEKSGEVVKAFIVKKDKSLSEKELDEFCKTEMTGYKRPKYYEFRDELPKSNVGKILRKDLRGSCLTSVELLAAN